MVEEIIATLSRIRWLFVIARNSTFTYKGQSVDVKQVGRELGVRYILEGSVRKAGNRVRITGQLIDAITGTHLWADRFDGSLEDGSNFRTQLPSENWSWAAAGAGGRPADPSIFPFLPRRAPARPCTRMRGPDPALTRRPAPEFIKEPRGPPCVSVVVRLRTGTGAIAEFW